MQETQYVSSNLPRLSTVKNLPSQFPLANLTPAAIQGHIFKSQDRFDSKGVRFQEMDLLQQVQLFVVGVGY